MTFARTVPKNARFAPCRRCTLPVTSLASSIGDPTVVDANGMPHALQCRGNTESQARARLDARLAELKAGKT